MSIKKTAIYIRVSSDKQAQDGDSIGAQRDALMNYVNSRDDLVFAGEYLDDGVWAQSINGMNFSGYWMTFGQAR